MSKIKEGFKSYPQHSPQHGRLCYIYSKTIAKSDAVIAAYWEAEDPEFDLPIFEAIEPTGAWILEDKDMDGLRWAHLPLPNEYRDEMLY